MVQAASAFLLLKKKKSSWKKTFYSTNEGFDEPVWIN